MMGEASEAADTLERLQSELDTEKALRIEDLEDQGKWQDKAQRYAEALGPFAAAADSFDSYISDSVVADHRTGSLTVGDFRRAREALEERDDG